MDSLNHKALLFAQGSATITITISFASLASFIIVRIKLVVANYFMSTSNFDQQGSITTITKSLSRYLDCYQEQPRVEIVFKFVRKPISFVFMNFDYFHSHSSRHSKTTMKPAEPRKTVFLLGLQVVALVLDFVVFAIILRIVSNCNLVNYNYTLRSSPFRCSSLLAKSVACWHLAQLIDQFMSQMMELCCLAKRNIIVTIVEATISSFTLTGEHRYSIGCWKQHVANSNQNETTVFKM